MARCRLIGLNMKLHVSAVGKLKNGPERTLCGDYFERAAQMGRRAGITALTVQRSLITQEAPT